MAWWLGVFDGEMRHPQLAAEEASNGGQQFQISGCIDVDDVDDVAGEHVVDFDFND